MPITCFHRQAAACRASGESAGSGHSKSPQTRQEAPWKLGNYFSKKTVRMTDSLGNIISSPETIATAPGWTADAQLRLSAEMLAPVLQKDAAVLLDQVHQLQALLPGIEPSLRRVKPADLVRMAADLEKITQQLVTLRDRFPTADVAAMVAAHPPLLQMAPERLEAAVAAVQQAFPDASQADLEAMLSANAALLDGGVSLQRCLAGIGHLMSRPQLMRCLQQDPAFLYQFQPLESLSRGERDADYQAEMFQP